MIITSRRDLYRGLVTIQLAKLRECCKYSEPFKCDCGCEFFQEDYKRVNMVRCNLCKVWHKLEFHMMWYEVALAKLDQMHRETKDNMRDRVFTVRPEVPKNSIRELINQRDLSRTKTFVDLYGGSTKVDTADIPFCF